MRGQIFRFFSVSLIINMAALSISLYTMMVYSVIIPSGATNTIWSLALLAVVVVAGGWALRIGRQFLSSSMATWAGTRIGATTIGKMLALPISVRDYLRLRVPTLGEADAFAAFERVLGADWRQLSAFGCSADQVLDRELNSFSEDIAELQFRHLVALVAATLN